MSTLISCSECSHANVCKHMKEFGIGVERLLNTDTSIEDSCVHKAIDNELFDIYIKCKYFEERVSVTR